MTPKELLALWNRSVRFFYCCGMGEKFPGESIIALNKLSENGMQSPNMVGYGF